MKTATLPLALPFAICLAVLTACGGDNGDNELDRALRSITENDLAIMVLPQEDLGEEFADLQIDDESGFVDNEEAADDTVDPDDTADDLERAGRINGYQLNFSIGEAEVVRVLQAGEGVILVGTEVELFDDADSASDYLAKQVEDRPSEALLEGRFQSGDTVRIDVENEEIILINMSQPALA
jgi:hypothetical protein